MYENVKKYAPKVVNILETIEEDKAYRLRKSASYNEQIAELSKEIDELTKKSLRATDSTKDSIYKKVEDLTIRRIGLTQLRESMANRDASGDAEEIEKAFEIDRVAVDKRIQELQTKMLGVNVRLKEAEDALEEERATYSREQSELSHFVSSIRLQIKSLKANTKPNT
ncbi:hypothetical protein EG832_02985 [bacterium]|nr:hypothetical protein [bacterium]